MMNKSQLPKTFLLGLLVGGAPLMGIAQDAVVTETVTAVETPEQVNQMWYDFGWLVSQSAAALELTDQERAEFIKGIEGGLTGQKGPGEDPAVRVQLNEFLQNRYMKVTSEKNNSYFSDLAKDPEVKKSDSGLYYKIIKQGSDKKAGKNDTVRVHYKGALIDGTVFDDSFKRGEPATFPVNGVVPGFGEGVQLVGEGGEAILYIPGDLGYGENPPMGSGIPPNATLVFEVQVESVNP